MIYVSRLIYEKANRIKSSLYFFSEDPSRYNTDFDGSALTAVPSFEGKSTNQKEISLSGELADEGIGGNQEDFYSPTSDSDDSDGEEPNYLDSKPDLPKDEGIDTCYHSTNFSEAGPIPDESENDTESDTDSSISFLMDENEAKHELNKQLDVVNLPSCFIPNADLNEGKETTLS